MNDDLPELETADFERAISARLRIRVAERGVESGGDVVAIRRFTGLNVEDFALAIGVGVDTVRGWESGACRPEGPAMNLLRIAARHPGVFTENIRSAVER